MAAPYLGLLPDHGRFDYRPITRRPAYRWPGGAGLAVYIGFNLEHFAFGEGLGAAIGPPSPQPDVLNHSWREYGNRVGAWRCLELFDQLGLPTAALINTALYDHCPELVEACVARGDELVGHGHTNAERQGVLDEADERALLLRCRERMRERQRRARRAAGCRRGSPRACSTPDLLAETGYAYTLNWCHDDQPMPMRTRGGQRLWAVPYPQELNDIPMIVARQMDAKDFAQMVDRPVRRDARAVARAAAGDGHRAAPVPRRSAVPAAPPAARTAARGACARARRGVGHARPARSATTWRAVAAAEPEAFA